MPQDQASNTIGQNVSTTPLQLAAAYTVLAYDGVYVPPRLVDTEEVPPPHRILAPEIAQSVRSMLIHVVEASSLRDAKIPGMSVAGKTGTADIFDRQLGRYTDGDYALTFAGMFPAEHPRVVMIVTVQKPKLNKTSTYVAAPLFRAIGSEVVAHCGAGARERRVRGEPLRGGLHAGRSGRSLTLCMLCRVVRVWRMLL